MCGFCLVRKILPLLLFAAAAAGFHHPAQAEVLAFATGQSVDDALARRTLPTQNGEALLRFSVEPVARCSFGDLNAIIFDLLSSPPGRTELLLTIEELYPGKDEVLAAQDISNPAGLTGRGLPVETPVAIGGGARLLAVSICKHSGGRRACLAKERTPIAEIIKQYARGIKPDHRAPDRIYYFRPMILDGSELHYPARGLTAEHYPMLERRFFKHPGANTPSVRKALDLVRSLGKTLGSKTLRERSGGELQIMLPYYDRKKCGL